MPAPDRRVLILGGTADARKLSALLEEHGVRTLTSLAGITSNPAPPAGEGRRGGFGGVPGLTEFLEQEQFDAVCDATHPFAAQISAHAATAAKAVKVPLLRIERPAWVPGINDHWTIFGRVAGAVAGIARGAHVLLTIGRKEAAAFFARPDLTGVARMIEPFEGEPPPRWRIVLERPPYSLEDEIRLLQSERFTVLVTKNSGGNSMRAKLDAARAVQCPVIMIARPGKPPVDTESTPERAALRLLAMLNA